MLDKDPKNLPSPTFCALPWMHISTRPNGHMRVCCTANASAVQDKDSTNKTVSEAGVLRRDDAKPANLATTSLLGLKQRIHEVGSQNDVKGERPVLVSNVLKKKIRPQK